MRGLAEQVMSWVAIYAVALYVILLGLVPIAANDEIINPFSAICHSIPADTAGDEASAKPDPIPGQACEHCNLCSAAPPPAYPSAPTSLEVVRALPDMRPLKPRPSLINVLANGVTNNVQPLRLRGPVRARRRARVQPFAQSRDRWQPHVSRRLTEDFAVSFSPA